MQYPTLQDQFEPRAQETKGKKGRLTIRNYASQAPNFGRKNQGQEGKTNNTQLRKPGTEFPAGSGPE